MENLEKILDVALAAAHAAGRRTLAYFQSDFAVENKSDDTPVTIADREAEHIARQVITASFPDHAIVGEEHGRSGDGEIVWYIDPIDGTKSFVRGIPLYSVLIGCEIRGRIEAGVIYLPALNEIVAAASGNGCWWNGRCASVSTVSRLSDALFLCTDIKDSRSRFPAYTKMEAATKTLRCAFDAYGYALVATGRADVIIDPVMKPWDCGPLPVILREAGGRFSDWSGKETIHGGNAIATNPLLYEAAMNLIK